MILRKILSGITWLSLAFLAWVFMPVFLALTVFARPGSLSGAFGDTRRENSAALLGFLILVSASQVAWWVILLY